MASQAHPQSFATGFLTGLLLVSIFVEATRRPVCFSPNDWESLVKDYAGEAELIRNNWLRYRPARVEVGGRCVEILGLEAANLAMTECTPTAEDYTKDRLTAADLEHHGLRFFDWETFRAIAAMHVKQDVASYENWKRQDKEKRRRQLPASLPPRYRTFRR
jgi:hypothetical protein